MAGDILGKLKQFDAYPKTLEDFRVKTFGGATSMYVVLAVWVLFSWCVCIVTLISATIIALLFLSELTYFLSTDVSAYSKHVLSTTSYKQVREELYVDTARAEKLKINFDIDFPRMPCLCELVHVWPHPLINNGYITQTWV